MTYIFKLLKKSIVVAGAAAAVHAGPVLAQSTTPGSEITVASTAAVILDDAASGQAESQVAHDASAPTPAAPAQEVDGGLAEILVTANRRSENLQRVPASVAAITGDDLQARGINTAADLSGELPNVRVASPFAESQPNFTIRGIGVANEFNANAQSPIGVYFDEVYEGFRPSHGAALYDLERIEVLKGPQGTLYGRNTTGGAINIISRKPDLEGDNGYLTGGYGDYHSFLVQGAGEVTLIDDKLGVRVAFTRSYHDGYIKNAGPENGYPGLAGDHDFQEDDEVAGRMTVRFKPVDNVDITVRGFTAYDNPIGSGGVPYLIGPNQTDPIGYSRANLGDREVIEPSQGRFITKANGGQARVDWTLGNVVLTSVSGYDNDNFDITFDFSGSPNSIGVYRFSNSHFNALNQDIHATYDGGTFKLIGGVYAGRQRVTTQQDLLYFGFLNTFAGPNQFNPGGLFFTGAGAPPPTAVSTLTGYQQSQSSQAAYAEATIDFTSKLHFTLGGRMTHDLVTFRDYYSLLRDSSFNPALYAYSSGATTPGIGILSGAFSPNLEINATKPTGRAILNYDLTSTAIVYGSYSRGYRSGSFNGSSPVAAPNSVGPEFVDAYEAGFKMRFADNRVQLNGAIFYSKYTGQQVQEVVDGASFIHSLNGRLAGAELELTAQVAPKVRVVAAAGYLHTRYNDEQFLAPGDPRETDPRGIDVGGDQFPFAPQITGSISPEWTMLETSAHGKLVLAGEMQYQSHEYFDMFNAKQAVGPFAQGQGAYSLFNGRLSYGESRYSVAVYAKNIFDKYYNSYGINTESFGSNYFVPGPPRTFGGEATVRF